MSTNTAYRLTDKYTLQEGSIILTGVQALVRIPIDQHLADKARGLRTATFISGYRGSPLGGLDQMFQRNQALLDDHHIVFKPGVNEELAASAVWGSQMAGLFPDPKFDGVLGMWYGKAPGVDRSGDSLRHANFMGIGKNGGVLALAGDDPASKSSSIPCASEMALCDAMIPILYPGNIQEVIDMGRWGFEMSRYSGFWTGYKCVTDVMDGFGTAEVSPDRVKIVQPEFEFRGKPWQFHQIWQTGPPKNLITETELYEGRLEAVKAFIAVNRLNKILVNPSEGRLGIVAAGKTYYDLKEAFKLMGLSDELLHAYGIRLLKLGAIFPLEEGIVHAFAKGLDRIIVIEEKRDFIESQITKVLYNSPSRPSVYGKRDEGGKFLFPAYGELTPDIIYQKLASQLEAYIPEENFKQNAQNLDGIANRKASTLPARTPYFCSGCPHNSSVTQLPKDSIAGGGIGCHGMVFFTDNDQTFGMMHMGSDGAQWIGAESFTHTEHFIQNIGDGTFAHSGSLSVRQAIASGTNMTYKILYNNAVAMTGGQVADGGVEVPELTRLLEAEGVKQIIVTTNDLNKYPDDAKWASNADIWERDRILEAQEVLKQVKGVTVLIHDQGCAAELRRMRKKGIVETPKRRVFINEEVCEGCGDCGVKSNCLSVTPVETPLGRKTQIHQSSCNVDYSCLKGDCPSFLTVIPSKNGKKLSKQNSQPTIDFEQNIPDPKLRVGDSANVYMMGIGGTGVVTVNQILGTAAMLDGKEIYALDQIGLSQKGGAVVSHFKIVEKDAYGGNRIPTAGADCYIGFDILTASQVKSLKHARPDKTLAIISTNKTPTGAMVRSHANQFPSISEPLAEIEKYTLKDQNIYLDAAKLSNQLFGSHYQANILLIGVAFQKGCIPISAVRIEEAIRLNGVQVENNVKAFRAGRLYVIQPDHFQTIALQTDHSPEKPTITSRVKALIDQLGMNAAVQSSLELRVPELMAYQNQAYAQSYIDFLQKVVEGEQAIFPGETKLTETVSIYLYKLMAYKDEYEVARLHTKAAAKAAISKEFGEGARYAIMLHPPILRAMGYERKIKFPGWTMPLFKLLAAFKFLRNTPLDIFGYAKVRKGERVLIKEYKTMILDALDKLSKDNYEEMIELAALPDMIRGYEEVKLANVERYRKEVERLNSK